LPAHRSFLSLAIIVLFTFNAIENENQPDVLRYSFLLQVYYILFSAARVTATNPKKAG
jgi:hypothetical protein